MNHTTADYLESLINDLVTLKTNLAAKGVEVTEDDDFTSLAAKVPMITSGAFKVASIAERDTIQYKREGDICLVMRDEAYESTTPTLPITANSIINFKRTVTFEQEPQGWSGLWLTGGSGLNLMYNQLGSYDQNYIQIDAGNLTITYHTEDGLTFTTDDDYSYVPSADLTYSNGDMNYLNLMELLQYTPGEYLGLYTYNGSAWVGVDFGDDVTTADIILGKKAIKNTGLITGTFPRYNVKKDIKLIAQYQDNTLVLPADASDVFSNLTKDTFNLKVDARLTKNFERIFQNCRNIVELDLSNWQWPATNMGERFNNAFTGMSALRTLNLSGLRLSDSNLNPYNTLSYAFPSTLETLIWKDGWWGNTQFMNLTFTSTLTNLKYIDLTNTGCNAAYNRWQNLFANNSKLETIIMKNFYFGNMSSTQNFPGGFSNKQYLKKVDLEGARLSQTNTTSFFTFSGDVLLEDLNLNFNSTISPTYLLNTFKNCRSLTNIDLIKVGFSRLNNTSNALNSTFAGCNALTTINNINKALPAGISNLYATFEYCNSLVNLDLSNWATPNVTSMNQLFNYCTSLQHLDIRRFDFTNVANYASMFGSADSAASQVPANCEIIVADQTAKDWITTNFAWLTNVQTVAEYEASLEGGE
jgi:surface protein